jgi:hypothetical protein
VISDLEAPARRRLTQRGAALALGIGLLAIPAVPAVVDALLPERVWETATFDESLTVTSADGVTVTAIPPTGWQIQDRGTAAVLRDGDAVVTIEVYDLAGRDPRAVTQRLMRSSRVGGINTTPDGGHISSAEGGLSGDTCVAVTADSTGTCAYLTDGEVLVSVISLGGPESPSAPLADIVTPLIREQS